MNTRRKQARLTSVNCKRVSLIVIVLSITGCASVGVVAPDGPAQIAQTYVGQPLVDLQSQLGPPEREQVMTDYTLSTQTGVDAFLICAYHHTYFEAALVAAF